MEHQSKNAVKGHGLSFVLELARVSSVLGLGLAYLDWILGTHLTCRLNGDLT